MNLAHIRRNRALLPQGLRECKVCSKTKALSEFFTATDRRDGKTRPGCYCKACNMSVQRTGRASDPDRYREYQRKAMGVHLDHASEADLYERQKGACAICNRPFGIRQLHADHNHRNGIVRGLLCGNCNRGIGCLADNPLFMERAAIYVRNEGVQLK